MKKKVIIALDELDSWLDAAIEFKPDELGGMFIC